MTQPAKSNEPSMEEILASIRRIIADDDPKNPPAAPDEPPPKPSAVVPPTAEAAAPQEVAPPEAVADEAMDVLELTESMAAPVVGFRSISGESDLMFDEPEDKLPPPRHAEPVPPLHEPRPQSASGDGGLVSSITSAAVDAAFNTLGHTVLAQNARTLEDLVREMLRPMLKTWLDDNLPGLVDRLVRAEIERVTRGRS